MRLLRSGGSSPSAIPKPLRPMKPTAYTLDLMAMPFWVVTPAGDFTEGHGNRKAADAACKEMNAYAREAYWRVIEKPCLV